MTDAIAVPTSREQLWGLLAEAAEIEHHLMCCYLYAAFSLKEGTDEDLSDAELAAVRRWRAEIFAVAIEEMGHLATVCNILSSLGAPAHLDHQNFPVSAGYHPAGVVVKLTPFNPQTLAHFIYLERPGDADVADGAGFEPARHYVRDSQMDRLMTVTTEYRTVGRLYESINLGLAGLAATLGESRLFAGDRDGGALDRPVHRQVATSDDDGAGNHGPGRNLPASEGQAVGGAFSSLGRCWALAGRRIGRLRADARGEYRKRDRKSGRWKSLATHC